MFDVFGWVQWCSQDTFGPGFKSPYVESYSLSFCSKTVPTKAGFALPLLSFIT